MVGADDDVEGDVEVESVEVAVVLVVSVELVALFPSVILAEVFWPSISVFDPVLSVEDLFAAAVVVFPPGV